MHIKIVWLQLLSIAPWDIMRWSVVGITSLTSAMFLSLNLRTQIKTASERWFAISMSAAVLHLALGVVVKLYFFTYFYHDTVNTKPWDLGRNGTRVEYYVKMLCSKHFMGLWG